MTVIGHSDLSECNLVMGCAKKIFNGEQVGASLIRDEWHICV